MCATRTFALLVPRQVLAVEPGLLLPQPAQQLLGVRLRHPVRELVAAGDHAGRVFVLVAVLAYHLRGQERQVHAPAGHHGPR